MINTKNAKLNAWVKMWADIMQPENIYLCDGSEEEFTRLMDECVANGLAKKLNEKKRPNSYYFQSDPSDVARVENRTFICSKKKEDVGPTNNWMDPAEMKNIMINKYNGCMKGRTMYVIPFSMGPLGGAISQLGVEITDSSYVVGSMKIMTRMGKKALELIEKTGDFIPCVHSVGKPLPAGLKDAKWPCAPIEDKYIVQFPEEREIWTFGSGYGGNALLGKKCFALRIASKMAQEEGWLAEHMLILKLTKTDTKETKYVCAGFPSACGKTNLAMLIPTIPGWEVKTVGDDIAWMKYDKNGQLRAINPEAGFFGVAPYTSELTNKNALDSCYANTIFTNVGYTPDGDIWWEGIGHDCPKGTIDWKNNVVNDPASRDEDENPVAHKNSRFAAPANQCPAIDPEWENPEGVPVSAILFGGRRPSTVPLIHEADDWNHGVFMGSIVGSEVTAAAIGLKAGVRRDPFAMLPFCGYNMGDYFQHWINVGNAAKDKNKLPKIFFVNWFRKDKSNKALPGGFLWPGYGDNSRVLAYIFDRCDGKGKTVDTIIGKVPAPNQINIKGLNSCFTEETMKKVLEVKPEEWKDEVALIEEHYAKFGKHLPKELRERLDSLKKKIGM
ncbi:MAG TPA: phosphoenolpyruvate carboxykinase (GTP) [Paludibacteraceae bacterium]|nr:phosphoenolpyruvate carboxykinase (GTP) [Paludibacteraceae bacterium]